MGFSYHTTYHTTVPYHVLQYAPVELYSLFNNNSVVGNVTD